MTTYYVRKTGNNGSNGLSPATAWLTIGKALGASGIASGDTVYIGAGVYRECVAVNMAIPTVETFIIGDTDGSHTGDAGEVQLTAWLTDDKTAPVGANPTLHLRGRDHLTVERLHIIGLGSALAAAVFLDTTSDAGAQYCNHLKFTDCTIRGMIYGGGGATAFGVSADILFDRCILFDPIQNIELAGEQGTGSDYDLGITFQNCLIVTGITVIYCDSVGSGPNLPGGPLFRNCTFAGAGGTIASLDLSTTFPMTLDNCVFTGWTIITAGNAGEIVEDYNSFPYGYAGRTNVSTGAHTKEVYAPLWHAGEELQYGASLRPFGMPSSGSPLLGFGGSSPPSVDHLNARRPAGGESNLSATGAFERGNSFGRETGTVRSGSNAISITGPGYQDYHVRVDAVETTVSAWFQWDSTYAGTKPKLQVLNGGECGVADDEDTAVGGADSWEQLSLVFTPSTKGVVTVRFLSSDTDGGGKMFVDDLLRSP